MGHTKTKLIRYEQQTIEHTFGCTLKKTNKQK